MVLFVVTVLLRTVELEAPGSLVNDDQAPNLIGTGSRVRLWGLMAALCHGFCSIIHGYITHYLMDMEDAS